MNHIAASDDRPIKKILVVGAGAVGAYFGAMLFRANVDVTFLLRPKTFEHVSNFGLEIRTPSGDFRIHPPVIQDVSECASIDLIILAVKCYDLQALINVLQPLVKKGAILLTLQNGITAEEDILRAYPEASLLSGVSFITSRRLSRGVISHSKNGMIALGEWFGGKSIQAEAVYSLLSEAGISCFLKSRIQKTKWEKLCWNATFNPLSVILDHPVSLILDSEALLTVVREGIREIMSLASAEGISLNPGIIENTITSTEPLRDYYTSMYEDYHNGLSTEIEYLNGEILRRGEQLKIPTPTHAMLYHLIKGLERKRHLA